MSMLPGVIRAIERMIYKNSSSWKSKIFKIFFIILMYFSSAHGTELLRKVSYKYTTYFKHILPIYNTLLFSFLVAHITYSYRQYWFYFHIACTNIIAYICITSWGHKWKKTW